MVGLEKEGGGVETLTGSWLGSINPVGAPLEGVVGSAETPSEGGPPPEDGTGSQCKHAVFFN